MMNSVATLNSLFFRELKVQLTVCCEGGILSGEVVSVVCLPFFFFCPTRVEKRSSMFTPSSTGTLCWISAGSLMR